MLIKFTCIIIWYIYGNAILFKIEKKNVLQINTWGYEIVSEHLIPSVISNWGTERNHQF